MPAPVTGTLDTFNAGAAQNLNVRTGWAAGKNQTTDATLKTDAVPTTAIVGTAGVDNTNIWNTSFAADQEANFVFGSAPDTAILMVRCNVPAGSPQTAGYVCRIVWNGGLFIEKINLGVTLLTLAAATFPNPIAGDQFNFTITGTTMVVWRKSGAGAWALIPGATVTDGSFTGAGYIGLGIENGSTANIDTFGGGSTTSTVVTSGMASRVGAAVPYAPPRSRSAQPVLGLAAPVAAASTSRATASYSPPRSQVLTITGDGTAVQLLDRLPVAASRPVAPYSAPLSRALPVVGDGTFLLSLLAAASRAVAPYFAPLSRALPIVGDGTAIQPVTSTDSGRSAVTGRVVLPYSPPPSQVLVIVGDGTAVMAPVSSAFVSDLQVPSYAAPRSRVTQPFSDDFFPLVLPTAYSRPVPNWPSARPVTFFPSGDPSLAGLALQTAYSRQVPNYSAPRPLTVIPADNPIVPALQIVLATASSRPVPFYVARSAIFFAQGVPAVVVDYPAGGGGFGAEMGGKFLNRYQPGYSGQYAPRYRSHMRKVKA